MKIKYYYYDKYSIENNACGKLIESDLILDRTSEPKDGTNDNKYWYKRKGAYNGNILYMYDIYKYGDIYYGNYEDAKQGGDTSGDMTVRGSNSIYEGYEKNSNGSYCGTGKEYELESFLETNSAHNLFYIKTTRSFSAWYKISSAQMKSNGECKIKYFQSKKREKQKKIGITDLVDTKNLDDSYPENAVYEKDNLWYVRRKKVLWDNSVDNKPIQIKMNNKLRRIKMIYVKTNNSIHEFHKIQFKLGESKETIE